MKGRRFVWSHPTVIELAARFVPVADEVGRLQTGSSADCRLFQQIAEQGHYAGRSLPSSTRQGHYAAAPSGVLLASLNSNDPERVADMLRQALARWESLPREERLLPQEPGVPEAALGRGERLYPEGGLVLRVNSRDLPRETGDTDWTAQAWNQDFAWFTRDEARGFLPERPEPGMRYELSDTVVRRIARCNLVDNVRGQTSPFKEEEIERARISGEVVEVAGDVVTLRFEGETRASVEGVWPIRGMSDRHTPTPQRRGLEMRLRGHARSDLKQGRFLALDMVALGTRWGATQYNVRADDREVAPIGFAFTLAGDSPAERVAPAFLRAYGWEEAPGRK